MVLALLLLMLLMVGSAGIGAAAGAVLGLPYLGMGLGALVPPVLVVYQRYTLRARRREQKWGQQGHRTA